VRLKLLLLALLLAGCGGQADGGSTGGTTGNLTVQASPSRLHAGGTVNLTATVTGPADYEAACVQTVHFWALNTEGAQVWEEPVPAIACMAIGYRHLAAGETASFTAAWPTSPGIAKGSYSIHGLFLFQRAPGAVMRVRENLPPVTVEITG
jgi:hypothetical protein